MDWVGVWLVMGRDLAREDAFLSRRPRVERMAERLWHPLHAARVDLGSLDAALDQLEAVLGGAVLPLMLVEPAAPGGDEAVVGEGRAIPLVEDRPRNRPPVAQKGRKRGWRPSFDPKAPE